MGAAELGPGGTPAAPSRLPARPGVGDERSGGLRILLARPDHLGDVLLTLPAATALRRAAPDARISYLVAPGSADILARCPAVDETIPLSFPPPGAPPCPPGWAKVVADAAPSLGDRFDAALLPRLDDPWSGAVVAAAGVPMRVGFAVPATRPFLTHPVPAPGRCHVAQLGLRLARAALRWLGRSVPVDEAAPHLPRYVVPTPADEREAAALLAETGAVGGGPLVLHPGSGWAIKNWPPARWGALAAELRRRYGTVPLVVGGPGEGGLVAAVTAASDGAALGLAERLSLGGLAALHRRARLVIGTDSGPLHLAALMGVPVIGLYGPADPVEFGPLGPAERRRVIRAGLPCSPCRSLDAPPCGCRSAAPCVLAVGVETVLRAAHELLGAAPAGSARPPARPVHQEAGAARPVHLPA